MAFNVSYIFQARDQFSGTARKIKGSMDGIRKKTAAVGRKLDTIGRKFVTNFKRKAARAIASAKQKLDRFSASLKKLSRNVRNAGGSLTAGLTLPIIALGTASLIQSAKMESLQVSFETMLGSVKKAKTLVSDLTKFTATTPFQLEGVSKSAKTLLAFGVVGKDMIPTLRMLGDVAAGTGAPLSDIAQIFGKAKAKGKLMTEELLQLSERGIPIIQDLATHFGVTTAAIFDAASKSKISFQVMQDSLTRLTSKGGIFFDQTKRQSRTLGGIYSTLKDNIVLTLVAVGDLLVEVFDIKGGLTGLINKLSELPAKIKAFSQENPAMAKFVVITVAVIAALGPLLLIFGTIGIAVAGLAAGLAILFSPITLIVAGVILAILGIAFAIAFVRDNWIAIGDAIGGTIEQIGINITNIFTKIKGEIKSVIDGVKGFFSLFGGGPIFSGELKTRGEQAKQFVNSENRTALGSLESNKTLNENRSSESEINVNINAPPGVVESVKTKRTRGPKNMNLGVNMVSAA